MYFITILLFFYILAIIFHCNNSYIKKFNCIKKKYFHKTKCGQTAALEAVSTCYL